MAIPHRSDHPTTDPDKAQRAYSSQALPIVVLILLLITVVAAYYWYA